MNPQRGVSQLLTATGRSGGRRLVLAENAHATTIEHAFVLLLIALMRCGAADRGWT